MRLQEPAGDLAVAAALASSVYDRALPADAIFLGEVGLGGEIRPVSQIGAPPRRGGEDGHDDGVPVRARRAVDARTNGIRAVGVRTMRDLFGHCSA